MRSVAQPIARRRIPAIMTGMLLAVCSAASAQSLHLSQSSGPGGITITATSSGFDDLFNTGFYVDGGFVKACPAGDPTARANCQVALIMPGGIGEHTVRAANSGGESAVLTFTAVHPTFRLQPTCGEQEPILMATGQNFPVGFDVAIYVDGAYSGTHQFPDSSGRFSISLAPPAFAAGAHSVSARNSVGVNEVQEFDAGVCEVIGTAVTVSGTFEVLQADGTWRPLQAGDSVKQNAVVRTLANSGGTILFLDNTQLTLSANTRIRLDEYAYDPTDNNGAARSSWLDGAFSYVSGLLNKKQPDNIQLDTPYGTLGIRGTEFIGNLDILQDRAELYLIEGTLAVTPLDEGLNHVYTAPQTIILNRAGIVLAAPLARAEYDAIKDELFPPPASDTTAPVTTPQLTPGSPNGTNGWYTSSVAVALSATDSGSGVASTTYELDGGVTTTYAGALTIIGDGNHVVAFRSQDNAGHIEADQSVSLKIDVTPPTNLGFLGGIANGDTFAEGSVPASPACAAVDETSGLLACVVTGYGTTTGSYTLTATATDNAGNTNTLQLRYSVTAVIVTSPNPIGYWKSNLTSTASLLPQPLGTFSVVTSADAAAVFKAASSKNAYEMLAAQLLGAELNRANGVPAGCVTDAIADANALLAAARYNGPVTTSPPAKAPKTAVTTNTTRLEDFNKTGCLLARIPVTPDRRQYDLPSRTTIGWPVVSGTWRAAEPPR